MKLGSLFISLNDMFRRLLQWVDQYDLSRMSRDSIVIRSLPYLLTAAVIFLQYSTPLLRAEFWAEDLTEIFKGAYELGPLSIITPVWGYHMFIPRLIGYAATFFPVIAAPYIYAFACYILAIITMGYFSRDGFSFVIPSRSGRIAVCMLLAMAPGTAEVLLNFANLTTVSTMLAVLLMVEYPRKPGAVKIFFFTILAFSAGQLFLFLPAALLLLIVTRRPRYLIIIGIVATVMVINFLGVVDPAGKTATTGHLSLKNMNAVFRVFFDNFFVRLFYLPFFGRNITEWFMRTPDFVFWPFTMIISGACVYWAKKMKPYRSAEFWLWLAIYCGTIATFSVVALVRNGMIIREYGYTYWGTRYSFLPSIAVLLWWLAAFRHTEKNRAGRIMITIAVILLVVNSMSWWVTHKRLDLHWPAQAQQVQAALNAKRMKALTKPVTVIVRAHPTGWHGAETPVVISP
ncbi:MAG: hypothetical protein AABZ39_09545 [Spirochaetota bacterium]